MCPSLAGWILLSICVVGVLCIHEFLRDTHTIYRVNHCALADSGEKPIGMVVAAAVAAACH